jgi:multimeric flavodoxin WrbA
MNSLKFLHLQIGQQFEFRGQHYTKVAPLIASNNSDGGQKMIPRSALVTVQEGNSVTTDAKHPGQHPALAVLERYHQTAIAELKSLGGDEAKTGAARARLEGLRGELAKAIQQS